MTLYWAEGMKDKPYSRRESPQFVNSDPNVVKSADLCRRAEGAWYGIVLGANPATRNNVRFRPAYSPMV